MYSTITISMDHPSYEKNITIYKAESASPKGAILYFHGGGLLYGNREDLPETHIEKITSEGYAILSYDYPLSPATKLNTIVEDVLSSIKDYLANGQEYLDIKHEIPYILWGRSAGAYLCLLAASKIAASSDWPSAQYPAGILSYYGYGFLTDGWFDSPSAYYRTLPMVAQSALTVLPQDVHCVGGLQTHYSAYVYARQTGTWKSLFYEGRDKFFYLDYSLRLVDQMPCPIFCAHSTGDTDVPYAEFLELSNKYKAKKFIASGQMHDFDRDEESSMTEKLLDETVEFLNEL